MKNLLLYIVAGLLLTFTACYKDKGNYDYVVPEAPVVSNLDTVYVAYSGDSLIISPVITLGGGRTDMTCEWKIDVPEILGHMSYPGNELRIVYGLEAKRYNALFTVTDNTTQIKYFYKFIINGRTEFTTGSVVLSEEAGVTKLSFIKPDGTVQPNIYEGINLEQLPSGPLEVVPVRNQSYMNVITAYWIVCSGGDNPAVQLDANTMKRSKYLKENFYEKPSALKPVHFERLINGTTTAILNGQMYIGTFETAPFAPYYGYFGVPVPGEYNLGPQLIYNYSDQAGESYYLGFDAVKRRFVRFDNSTYYGTTYQLLDDAFDPKDLKMDLIKMGKFAEDDFFAFCKGDDGKTYELQFGVDFKNTSKFNPVSKKEFIAADKVTPATRWEYAAIGVIYFTSGDKIYRYNPLNQEVRALNANFGGKTVTMIKLSGAGDRLIAGTEGKIYTLDVSTGKFGEVINTVDGIPGAPVDIAIRD